MKPWAISRLRGGGFRIKDCYINGKNANLADYIKEKQIDVSLPITFIEGGTIVNISIYGVDHQKKIVLLSAPVFNDRVYRFSRPVDYSRYADRYIENIPEDASNIAYSCICLWHYRYGALEGKSLKLPGIFSGGEIAWHLYNQTAVNLIIEDV